VTTETLEHIRDWKTAVHNMKRVLKPGGLLIITTRSFGFPFHCFPDDYWRYEVEDFQKIFGDLSIEALSSDPQEPGVFLRSRKPAQFVERDLQEHKLYNIHAGFRTCDIEDRHLKSPRSALLRALLTAKTLARGVRNRFRAQPRQMGA
jgi:hypothetical protein